MHKLAIWMTVGSCLATIGCTGGQTGDPGVADHTSIVRIESGTGTGSTGWNPPTDALHSSGVRKIADTLLFAIDDDRVLSLSPRLGLSVVELRDPDAPRLLGRVTLSGTPVDVQVVGSTAIVLQTFGSYQGERADLRERSEGSAISLIDLSDSARPRVVDTLKLRGNAVTSHLSQAGEQHGLFVVVDEYSASKKTSLLSIELSATALGLGEELTLGDAASEVNAVRASGRTLVVARRDGTLGIVQLSAADGSMHAGAYVEGLAFVQAAGISQVGSTLRVIGAVPGSQPPAPSRLMVYDASDPAQPRVLGNCPAGAVVDRPEPFSNAVWTGFAGELGFAQSAQPGTRTASVITSNAAGACNATSFETLGPAKLLAAVNGTRALYLSHGASFDGDRGRLQIQLFATDAQAEAGRVLASWPIARTDTKLWRIDDSTVQDGIHAAAPDGTQETGLLFVPWSGRDADGKPFEALQPFTFSDHTLTMRDTIRVAGRAFGGMGVASRTELTLLQGSAGEQLQSHSTLAIDATFDDAAQFDSFVARKHAPNDAALGLKLSDADLASLTALVELVPNDRDPQSGAAVAAFEVPLLGQLVRVGQLLISLSPTIRTLRDDSGRIAETVPTVVVDVFDVSEPAHPSHTATLNVAWPGTVVCSDALGASCLYRAKLDVITIPNGLVLPWHLLSDDPEVDSSDIHFSVLDLRDAAHPSMHETAHDGAGTLKSAFAQDSSLYYSFYVPTGEVLPDVGAHSAREIGAAYYYRTIDLRDPSDPQLKAAQRIPGELLAVSDQHELYASDRVLDGEEPRAWLHKLTVDGARPRVVASAALGAGIVRSMRLDRGHVVIDLMGPQWSNGLFVSDGYPPWGPATRLLTFDARSLRALGELSIDRWMVLRGLSGDRAVLQGIQNGQGIGVVDLHDPAKPRLQAYHWTVTPQDIESTLLFDGMRVVLEANGGLLAIDAGVENL